MSVFSFRKQTKIFWPILLFLRMVFSMLPKSDAKYVRNIVYMAIFYIVVGNQGNGIACSGIATNTFEVDRASPPRS